jgi:hypothetical protein
MPEMDGVENLHASTFQAPVPCIFSGAWLATARTSSNQVRGPSREPKSRQGDRVSFRAAAT